MLVELALGRSPDVVHVAAAMTFTLVLLLAAALARGRATGRPAVVRMAIAAGIMCSPQLGAGRVPVPARAGPLGSAVPVLLAWLHPGPRAAALVRAGRGRWRCSAWALVADSVVVLTGVLPLLTVCAVRLYHRICAAAPAAAGAVVRRGAAGRRG